MNNDYSGVVGDHLLISHFIRYNRLLELINAEFYNSNYNEVNVCIDMVSMVKSIYKLSSNSFIDKYSIASAVINACAHYRQFFWSRYRVTCKIWVVYSELQLSTLEARQFVPSYGHMFTNERNPEMDIVIAENIKALSALIPYINDVAFINSQYEPGLVFGKVALSCNGSIPTFIVSRDPWCLQVVANVPNTYVLRSIKRDNDDLSILIGRNNLMQYYADIRKNNTDMSNLDSSLLSFIIAATRFPERNIKSLYNINSVVKYLSKAIEERYITTDKIIYDITGLCEDLNKLNKAKLNGFEVNLRMQAIGFNQCMYRYTNNPYSDDINIINLHDPSSIKLINEKYFSKVPLDLMAL